MAGNDLQVLHLDASAVRSRTDFLEFYANTTAGELENLSRVDAVVEDSDEDSAVSEERWLLTMDAASALREAASWALYFDVGRAMSLLTRAGYLFQSADMAFGSFLLTIAGNAPPSDLANAIELLAQVQGRAGSAAPVAIPDSLRHPQQQAYLLLACAGMTDQMSGYRSERYSDQESSYRQTLHAIAAESPIRLGVLPFGALGVPIRVPWDIGVHLLQRDGGDSTESVDIVARYLAALCRRFAETMELASVNEYLWANAAAPVDVGDIEVIGMTALAMAHFGNVNMSASLRGLGVLADDAQSIPINLALEIAEGWGNPNPGGSSEVLL